MDPVFRTKLLLVGNLAALIAYDIITYKIDGNEATISKVWLTFASKYPVYGVPLVGGILLLLVGVFVGHIFFPQHVADVHATIKQKLLGDPGGN